MQTSPKILESGYKLLNFFLPVHKPQGMCCLKLGEAFKLDLYFVLERHGIFSQQIFVANCRYLEPFASGLLTFLVGKRDAPKKKNFALADYAYDLTIEFGVERQHHSIDGSVLSTMSTSKVNEGQIRELLPRFTGQIMQDRMRAYRIGMDKNRQSAEQLLADSAATDCRSAVELINDIVLPPSKKMDPRFKSPMPKQKYPYVAPKRETTVHNIELISYREPYADFRIACDGTFISRRFACDLANLMGNKASLVSLKRTQEGPMIWNDPLVLEPYELNFEYYADQVETYQKIYSDFHKQIEPLWEGKST